MQLTKRETALFGAVLSSCVLDLQDRGIVLSSEASVMLKNITESTSQGAVFFLKKLPCMGKALDAILLTDETVSRTLHQEALETFWSLAEPILGSGVCSRVLDQDPRWDPSLIRAIREMSYLFYKYELPPEETQVQAAVEQFVSTDAAVTEVSIDLTSDIALLERIFRGFDPTDIHPRHGPGSVANGETGIFKYDWTSFPPRLVDVFSYDYFVASFTHLSEVLQHLTSLPSDELYAKLTTVPKDSRGPRVISMEPKEFQWIQQGMMRKIVEWIEQHPITRGHVRFTDQTVNGYKAMMGSVDGSYATLDLSEASDRVSCDYVQRAFPPGLARCLFAARSEGTCLPDGTLVRLNKFAPMGSALCFPVLALAVFTRLRSAGIRDCHVYGDDVIVPKAQASLAMTALESVGLKINRSKSCMTGFFRESCGVDAYKGTNVTPLRIKRRWSDRHNPSAYVAWCSYANALYARGYVRAAEQVARELIRIYGYIPTSLDGELNAPHLSFRITGGVNPQIRSNQHLQRLETKVWTVRAKRRPFNRKDSYVLLNWLSQKGPSYPEEGVASRGVSNCLRASEYTRRGDVVLRKCWTHLYVIVPHQ